MTFPEPSEPRDASAHVLLRLPPEIDSSNAGGLLGTIVSGARTGDGRQPGSWSSTHRDRF
ncbi:hypothetical protein GCM10023238_39140 [Streptomyces heliomycini]